MQLPAISRRVTFPLILACSAASVWCQPFLYVTNQNSNNLSVIDTRTNAVTATAPASFSPSGVAISPDGARYFSVNPNANLVVVYSAANNAVVSSFSIGQLPSAVAADAQRIYVTLHGNAALAVFSATTFVQTASIRVGFGPNAVAVSPANGRVYVANTYSSTVSVIDPTRIGTVNNPVIATIPVPDSPIALAISPDGLSAWTLSSAIPTLSRLDLAANTVTTRIALPLSPAGLALSADGARAYVTGFGPKVTSVDLQAGIVLSTTSLPECDGPRCVAMGAAVSADGKTVYIANTSLNQVAVMDAAKGEITSNIRVQLAPRGLVISAPPRPPAPTSTTIVASETEDRN